MIQIHGKHGGGETIQGIEMYIMTNNGYEDKLQFTYQTDEFTDEQLKLKLNFEYPNYVYGAPNEDQDQLVIKLSNFRDKEGNLIIDQQEIIKPMPNQIDDDTALAVSVIGSTAAGAVGSSFSFNFILNLVLGTSMSQMLGSIKAL